MVTLPTIFAVSLKYIQSNDQTVVIVKNRERKSTTQVKNFFTIFFLQILPNSGRLIVNIAVKKNQLHNLWLTVLYNCAKTKWNNRYIYKKKINKNTQAFVHKNSMLKLFCKKMSFKFFFRYTLNHILRYKY